METSERTDAFDLLGELVICTYVFEASEVCVAKKPGHHHSLS